MDIYYFVKRSRKESIQSLEFLLFFRKEVFFPLVTKYGDSTNSLILDFLRALGGIYSWEVRKIEGYIQALKDSVFWESREFYRETMVKFVLGELTALEFAGDFSDRLLAEKEKANNLVDDFQKQAEIQLNLKSFQFSKIILEFEIPLLMYQDQDEIEDQMPEKDLSLTEDSLRKAVKVALAKIDYYFKD